MRARVILAVSANDANFCKPQAGSLVINAGEFTPNALDYYGNLRDNSRDIGAVEFNPKAPNPPSGLLINTFGNSMKLR